MKAHDCRQVKNLLQDHGNKACRIGRMSVHQMEWNSHVISDDHTKKQEITKVSRFCNATTLDAIPVFQLQPLSFNRHLGIDRQFMLLRYTVKQCAISWQGMATSPQKSNPLQCERFTVILESSIAPETCRQCRSLPYDSLR